MSRRGRRGRPRRVIPDVSERPAVPERDEHVVGSKNISCLRICHISFYLSATCL